MVSLPRRFMGSGGAWILLAMLAFAVLAITEPRVGTAQTCNRSCDPSKRDAQGCCPNVPVAPGPPTSPPVGRKCAVSAECPGDQVCIAYKCQKPPTGAPTAPPPPPPPGGGRYWWIGVAWNNSGEWAARTGTTQAEAQAAALQACNQVANGCYSSTSPISSDKPMCMALYRNGTALRSQADPSLPIAINRAAQDCAGLTGTGPGCYQQLAVCNDRPISAPSIWAWVGIGWNNNGGWNTRPATTAAEAQALALDACNKANANSCYNAKNPVPGEKLQCFALYSDGKNLYENHEVDLAQANAEALKACQAGPNPGGCKSQIQACNSRR